MPKEESGDGATSVTKFMDWAMTEGFEEAFQEVSMDFVDVCEEVIDVDFDTVRDALAPDAFATVFGLMIEAFANTEYEEGFLVDLFLKEESEAVSSVERDYLHALSRSFPSLYEVIEVVPKSHVVLRDHFGQGDPLTLMDELFSQTMVQWDWIYARVLQVGPTLCLGGATALMEPQDRDDIDRVMRNMARRNLKETPKALRRAPGMAQRALRAALRSSPPLAAALWISSRLDRLDGPQLAVSGGEALDSVGLTYAIEASSSEVAKGLGSTDDFSDSGDGIWTWIPGRESHGGIIHAFLKLERDRLFASTLSKSRADAFDVRIRDVFGARIELLDRFQGPLEKVMALTELPPGTEREPLDPEVSEQILSDYLERHYLGTLGEPIPMLGDRTPRDLVKTASGRRKVADWLKYIERMDGASSIPQGKRPFDFGFLWKELGIEDLRK